jgi:putative protein-disulfide isomerase
MTLYYIYDAYCGWCYGFSPVMKKIAEKYKNVLDTEVLSGGMIIDEQVHPISRTAAYIRSAYPRVEELTGVQFGEYYLWHINHPDESDWMMNSEKAAIALCIFKEYYPDRALEFAWDLQFALNYEGRDLCDDEAYRHLLEAYTIPAEDFYTKLHSEAYKDKARYEFALTKHLQVTGFPCVLLQSADSKFYLLANGYTDFETLDARVANVLREIAAK